MTAREPMPPSRTAEVSLGFGSDNYLSLCEYLYGGGASRWWADLADLLSGRPGWYCELTSEGLTWFFGPGGTGMFVVPAPDDPEEFRTTRYRLFDYEADESEWFDNVGELLSWLEANEHRHVAHLRRMLWHMGEGEDWEILTGYKWQVKVGHESGLWFGTVPLIPSEVSTASSLGELLRHLRELIALAVGAPVEVAPNIKLRATLDEPATAAAAL